MEADTKCRSSLSAESQAMADSVDMLNFVRLFFADLIHAKGVDFRRPDENLQLLPESYAITDCKSLYDALEKSESLGLGLSEKRTSIEVLATKLQMRATGLKNQVGEFRSTIGRCIDKGNRTSGKYFKASEFWAMENCMG